mmetsp:Transcript_40559/g.129312  ORF Transcript_40559/g.129312 Transcript_40559/m.129312 type:complete len:244 (-) Transcript_40559:547-1278(-)
MPWMSAATGLPALRSSRIMRESSSQSMPLASASFTAAMARSTSSRLYSMRAARRPACSASLARPLACWVTLAFTLTTRSKARFSSAWRCSCWRWPSYWEKKASRAASNVSKSRRARPACCASSSGSKESNSSAAAPSPPSPGEGLVRMYPLGGEVSTSLNHCSVASTCSITLPITSGVSPSPPPTLREGSTPARSTQCSPRLGPYVMHRPRRLLSVHVASAAAAASRTDSRVTASRGRTVCSG